jgi:hypothetical protein
MNHLLAACDLMEDAGRTHVPIPIKELRHMAARLKKSDIKIIKKPGQRTKLKATSRMAVSRKVAIAKSKKRRVVSPKKARAAR